LNGKLNLFLKEKRDFGFVKIGGAAKREHEIGEKKVKLKDEKKRSFEESFSIFLLILRIFV